MENKDIDFTVSGGDMLPSGDSGQLSVSSGDIMPQMEILSLTAEEIREAVYQSLEDYFSTETITVSVEKGQGINTPVDDLSLTDILLLALFLVVVGRGICDIIGGKGWRR